MFRFISDLNSKDVKMFSSINFLFLISLAVTTWIILCYFKQIEVQREEQMTVEVHMDNTVAENLKPNACLENYDIYLNFLGVFACIYALAKVASVAESYVSQQAHFRFKQVKLFSSQHKEPSTIDEYRVQHLGLTMQIENLEKENAKLEQRVKHLEQINCMLGGKVLVNSAVPACANKPHLNDFGSPRQTKKTNIELAPSVPRACICAPDNSSVVSVNTGCFVCDRSSGIGRDLDASSVHVDEVLAFRNMLIQDRQFQLTQQVYVNDVNVEWKFQDFNQEGGNITQIWQKYLEMQKYAIQKPTSAQTTTEMANAVPFVVSTEELQTIKGNTDQQRGKRQPQRTYPTSTTTTTLISRRLRSYHTTQAHMRIPQTTLTLPIQIYYTNLLICLMCWYF